MILLRSHCRSSKTHSATSAPTRRRKLQGARISPRCRRTDNGSLSGGSSKTKCWGDTCRSSPMLWSRSSVWRSTRSTCGRRFSRRPDSMTERSSLLARSSWTWFGRLGSQHRWLPGWPPWSGRRTGRQRAHTVNIPFVTAYIRKASASGLDHAVGRCPGCPSYFAATKAGSLSWWARTAVLSHRAPA